MSQKGKNIIATFREMREFCGQVSLLLKTCDSIMLKSGWKWPQTKNAAVTGSTAIDGSDYWIPYCMFRYYKHGKKDNILSFIAVLLDIDGNAISEPIITSGWFEFTGDKMGSWDYSYCCNHIHHLQPLFDGSWFEAENPQKGWKKQHKVAYFKSMALPIEDIKNSEELEEKIIKPLTVKIEGRIKNL